MAVMLEIFSVSSMVRGKKDFISEVRIVISCLDSAFCSLRELFVKYSSQNSLKAALVAVLAFLNPWFNLSSASKSGQLYAAMSLTSKLQTVATSAVSGNVGVGGIWQRQWAVGSSSRISASLVGTGKRLNAEQCRTKLR